jgi:hypothetical protein
MRVIAKKRCRAMVEPPEKGERATLNPNLDEATLSEGRHTRCPKSRAAPGSQMEPKRGCGSLEKISKKNGGSRPQFSEIERPPGNWAPQK